MSNSAERLKRNLEFPPHGYGIKHYSNLEPEQVKSMFEQLPDAFKKGFILIAEKATEIRKTNRIFRAAVRGTYWRLDKV